MHFLTSASHGCCKSELNLFNVPPTQVSLLNSNYVSINPTHSITNSDAPLEFIVTGSGDFYIDPCDIHLYLKVKLLSEDGSELPASDDHVVYTESNFLYTCLLYTSDAADERSSVDLGGRRIIKKKKHRGSQC